MKSLKYTTIAYVLFFFCSNVFAQDSLSVEVLKSITYPFTIENGKLKGEGADFLKKEIANAQFTMLGDFSGSKGIAELTTALIPELDKLQYKTMVLEVGPTSGKVLEKISSDPNDLIKKLKGLNQKYLIKAGDQEITPIPFFKNKEDGMFLKKAKEHRWNVIGVGHETWFGLKMLVDEMYSNNTLTDQNKNKKLYHATINELNRIYAEYEKGIDNKTIANSLKTSKSINQFLNVMSQGEKNLPIIEAFNFSVSYFWMTAYKQFYEKNALRVKKEKKLLREGLQHLDFDWSKDKMFVKMHSESLSKGFSSSMFYEVGNMLAEIPSLYGNSSLSIVVFKRFFMENEKLKDETELENYNTKNIKAILEVGKKEEWVIIDLRKLIKGIYVYPVHYHLTEAERTLAERYDILIIPKTEIPPTTNY